MIYTAFILMTVLAWLAPFRIAQFSKEFAGPYQVVVREIADCEYKGINRILVKSNKMSKFNRTTYIYSTPVYLGVDLDDSILLGLDLAVFGNGGWKENFFKQQFGGVCTTVKKYAPSVARGLFRLANRNDCPIPKGNYSFDFVIYPTTFDWPLIPYNRYRGELYVVKNGRRLGCKRIYADSVPTKWQKNHN